MVLAFDESHHMRCRAVDRNPLYLAATNLTESELAQCCQLKMVAYP
jgi:hypothetical protein